MIYLIPGLGADERVFNKLTLHPFSSKVITWDIPDKNDSLESYAKKLCGQIDPNEEIILVGLSMGGMLAVEICKILQVKACFLVSSIPMSNQFSLPIKLARLSGLQHIIPVGLLKDLNLRTAGYFFGVKDDLSKKALRNTILQTDPDFLTWAIRAILNWRNKTIPKEVIHIHGTRDRIFPLKYIQTPVIKIKGGGHWMIVEQAKEISQIIIQYLNQEK